MVHLINVYMCMCVYISQVITFNNKKNTSKKIIIEIYLICEKEKQKERKTLV